MGTDPDESGAPDMIAAELALGLLEGEQRAAALRRVIAEPDFAAAVQAWRGRLAALFASWPEAAPPPGLERRVLTVGSPAARPWRLLAAAGIGAAAAAALTVAILPRSAPRPIVTPSAARAAPLLAAIAMTGGGVPVAAAYDRDTGEIRLAGTVAVPAGHSGELWAINGTAAPVPLGLLRDGSTRITLAAQRRLLRGGTVLAISIEPAGGSPNGAPTGPVVATGTLAG